MSDGTLSTYIYSARRRRAAAEEDLALLEKRGREVNIAFDDATAQLRALGLTVEALAAERLEIQEKTATLRDSLREIPSAFDPRILQKFPVELLRTVFEQIASEPVPWGAVSNPVAYNTERATAPFRLASVCRRWRNVALETHGLWTYIALPVLSVDMGRPIYTAQLHIARLLKRSGSRPLDVLLRWVEDQAQWSDLGIFREIVSMVVQHMRRWRRAYLDFPLGLQTNDVEFLRCPAPLLQEFAIWSAGDAMLPSFSFPEYLPNSPRLEEFCSGTIFLVPRTPLLSLKRAHLTSDTHPASALWDALGNMPALEDLSLTFVNAQSDIPDPPHTELCLPALHNFAVHGDALVISAWASMLRLPHLRKLMLPVASIVPLQPLIEAPLAGIFELTLISDGDDEPLLSRDDAQILSHLARLRKLEITGLVCITSGFLDRLLENTGSVALPELNKLALGDIRMQAPAAESVVSFVKVRQGILQHRPDAAGTPDTLSNLVFSVELVHILHAPVWFVPQLESILGDSLVVFGSSTVGLPTQQDSDESEAEFTSDEGDVSSDSGNDTAGVSTSDSDSGHESDSDDDSGDDDSDSSDSDDD